MITRRGKILLVVLAVFALLAAVAAVVYRTAKPPAKALLGKMAEKVDLQARDVHFTQTGNAGMKVDIVAKSVSYQKQGEVALFEKVNMRLVMKDGRAFVMSADKGRMDTRSKDVTIEGNVVAVSDNGDTLKTERLVYRDKTKRVETDLPVSIENKKMKLDGVGMVLNLTDEKVTILSRVRSKSVMHQRME